MMSCVSFPEREKVRGPAFGREPCIDDRLPWPCALAKEKMPAEWLLNSNLGYLFCLAHIHILVFEPLVYHLLFFNYFVFQLLRIPNTV